MYYSDCQYVLEQEGKIFVTNQSIVPGCSKISWCAIYCGIKTPDTHRPILRENAIKTGI